MNRTVSVQVMRDSDAWTIANKIPSKELMRRAGEGIFRAAKWKGPVAIVCGSGNNAGDGYVVADLLKKEGIDPNESEIVDSVGDKSGKRYVINYIPFLTARLAADEDRIVELEKRLAALEAKIGG